MISMIIMIVCGVFFFAECYSWKNRKNNNYTNEDVKIHQRNLIISALIIIIGLFVSIPWLKGEGLLVLFLAMFISPFLE